MARAGGRLPHVVVSKSNTFLAVTLANGGLGLLSGSKTTRRRVGGKCCLWCIGRQYWRAIAGYLERPADKLRKHLICIRSTFVHLCTSCSAASPQGLKLCVTAIRTNSGLMLNLSGRNSTHLFLKCLSYATDQHPKRTLVRHSTFLWPSNTNSLY